MPENLGQQPTAAEFSLGTSANYFGLLRGSIDDDNTLEFLLDGTVDSCAGLDITNPADGNQNSPGTHTHVNFSLPELNGIRMTRSPYAFGSDNHAWQDQRPEPGALALFGAGLAGAARARRRTHGG